MLKTDFLAYIGPWQYQLHTCSSLFIKAITLLILFIIFLLGKPGASEPSPSSQPAPRGSPGLPQHRQHPAALPSWETRPGPLLGKADGNSAPAKMCPGISRIKIKARGSLWFEAKQVHGWAREAICRGMSAMWLRTAPKGLGCTTGSQHGRAGLQTETRSETTSWPSKNLFVPILGQTATELRSWSRARGHPWDHTMSLSPCNGRSDTGPSPSDSVVTSLLQHPPRAYMKAQGLLTQSCTSTELFPTTYFCQGWASNDLVTASVQ